MDRLNKIENQNILLVASSHIISYQNHYTVDLVSLNKGQYFAPLKGLQDKHRRQLLSVGIKVHGFDNNDND